MALPAGGPAPQAPPEPALPPGGRSGCDVGQPRNLAKSVTVE